MRDCKCGARLECVIGDYWQCADGCDTKDTQEWKPGALDKLAQDVALDEDSAVSALAAELEEWIVLDVAIKLLSSSRLTPLPWGHFTDKLPTPGGCYE